MATEIRVPTLGESVTEATIGKWFKKVGDAVAIDEPVSQFQPPPSVVDKMSVPGAERSMCGPRVANGARAPLSPTGEIPSTPGKPAG